MFEIIWLKFIGVSWAEDMLQNERRKCIRKTYNTIHICLFWVIISLADWLETRLIAYVRKFCGVLHRYESSDNSFARNDK